MKKYLSLLCVVLMIVLTACVPSAPKTSDPAGNAGNAAAAPKGGSNGIRVMWWGGDARHEKTLNVIDMFLEANPDIDITPEYMGGDTYWEKLDTQLAGGAAPDVLQMGGNLPDYARRNAIMPLNSFVDSGILDTSKLDQSVIDIPTIDGDLYGVCLGTNMLALVYNKTMLEAAGAPLPTKAFTWDELRDYCLQITPLLPSGTKPMTDNCANVSQSNYFGYFMRQNGTPVWNGEDSKVTAEAASKWLNLWAGYRADGIIPDAETSASYDETGVDHSSLVSSKTAISLIWCNQVGQYQDAMTDEIGIMHLPDLEKNALWSMPSQYMTINKNSSNPEAAAKFISFFVNDIEAGTLLGNDRGISANHEVRDAIAADATVIDQQIYKYIDEAAPHTTPMDPNLPNDQEYNSTLSLIAQGVAFGQKTPEQGGQEIYDLIQSLIKK